ncbi:MAG: RtcB family protein [Deltaproteobacteria bacterium]|nr:RtcB family protein [Deltaproteobacteria bacterium]
MKLKQIGEFKWQLEQEPGMNTPGIIYADKRMIDELRGDECLKQVRNVAMLPGIVNASIAMPDIHAGYGFPIGGVAAFDGKEGIISPGGVGYDINCGVRLLRTNLYRDSILNTQDSKFKTQDSIIERLVDSIFHNVPSGVGSRRKDIQFSRDDLDKIASNGVKEIIAKGYGFPEDTERIEGNGTIPGAAPDKVSQRAKERGHDQLGTLGSGNHFIEIGYVEEIFDPETAQRFGLSLDGITVLIHTGSRGYGYQVCDDYIRSLQNYSHRHGITLPDRQLVWAPIGSDEGKKYISAMNAAANFAFANRQLITHWVRGSFEQVLEKGAYDMGMHIVYDVAHNIAKEETYTINGKRRKVIVHRKGATRAFPAEHPEIPEIYRSTGQPVLIPGDMGRYSYVLVGTGQAMAETFGTVCHGAGRVMSRGQAVRSSKNREILKELREKGIVVRGATKATIHEEIPEAYKDVSRVVDIVAGAGLAKKVAKLRPLGVVKG